MLKQILQKTKSLSQPTLFNVLERIEQADDFEINEIIQAVIRRYKLVFPDWEIIFLSLPVQSEKRKLLLDQTIDQLKKIVGNGNKK